MKLLINRIKRAFILFQIRCIDRRYIRLNHDIAWYEQALIENRQAATIARLALLQNRSALRMKFGQLENH